ncbi:hypothetical protein J8L70_01940 [Pseudoalteromonas sp. MMG010]|uniref:hypothetical protein n=1 Tax=Pseudoalteromonas sp. MMG010 TaxID=2822685 RepID=UPI001B39E04E|nr:hypothetical protein [Pseudoalteromonas sp. MMG010]MBQ4831993.1 hypothetical protein [Pseudoalteromonas sp. MMG010]
MNSRYAAVFGIENLVLNQHFRSPTNDLPIDDVKSLSVNKQLRDDIDRALHPMVITKWLQASEITLSEQQLTLPSEHLSSDDKRALWTVMSQYLDNI